MNYIVLTCGTLLIAVFSWHFSIRDKRYHGISRFFSFESIFILFLLNFKIRFGDQYIVHMKETKMFIPFIF
ncbi:MAG: hypothetical protein V1903_07525 [Bacteroidota bacterium]